MWDPSERGQIIQSKSQIFQLFVCVSLKWHRWHQSVATGKVRSERLLLFIQLVRLGSCHSHCCMLYGADSRYRVQIWIDWKLTIIRRNKNWEYLTGLTVRWEIIRRKQQWQIERVFIRLFSPHFLLLIPQMMGCPLRHNVKWSIPLYQRTQSGSLIRRGTATQ